MTYDVVEIGAGADVSTDLTSTTDGGAEGAQPAPNRMSGLKMRGENFIKLRIREREI